MIGWSSLADATQHFELLIASIRYPVAQSALIFKSWRNALTAGHPNVVKGEIKEVKRSAKKIMRTD